ncbi:MAG: LacI family DNA-binding transcriptional regulator [Candidatus Sumerlaeia bacterium]|nr:LacI family DNA-binding transcriptional regulator [Candidatus Sumerlaeia bacterium]
MMRTNKDRKEVFIHDVAKAAGCSISTVSKAINNTGKVSAKTRRQVLRIAGEMGYAAHPGARSLRGRVTQNIGLLHFQSDIFGNYFYGSVGAGIGEVLAERNRNMVISPPWRGSGEYEVPKFVRERSVDGLLILGNIVDEIMDRLLGCGLPMVLVDTEMPGHGVDSIVSDGFNGARDGVNHLINLGHRDIAMLAASQVDWSTRQRYSGYVTALAEAGIPFREELVVRASHGEEGGRSAVHELLARDQDFSAIFSVNDEMAIGAMISLREAGLDVPRDVSLVGFDDIHLSRLVQPGLTTMRVDHKQMGRMAATLMLNRLESPPETSMQHMFPVKLVERGSTCRR